MKENVAIICFTGRGCATASRIREILGKGSVWIKMKADRSFRDVQPLEEKLSVWTGKRFKDSDLIIFSPGSLYTSILPHLIAKDIVTALEKAKAPIMYVSNLVTQPGETDGYNVSDHLEILNKYLGKRKVDLVVSNHAEIDEKVAAKYLQTENKTLVRLDREKIEPMGAKIIEDDIFSIENGKIRHDAMKTAFLIFSSLMRSEY